MPSSSGGSSGHSGAMAPGRAEALGAAVSGEWECECKQIPEWACKCQCVGERERKREQRWAGRTNWDLLSKSSTFPISSGFRCLGSPLVCPCTASDDAQPRYLRCSYTVVSEPRQKLGQINIRVNMSCQHLKYYDSKTLMKKCQVKSVAANKDQQYSDRQTKISQEKEQNFNIYQEMLQEHYNQSSGSHTVNYKCDCDFFKNGTTSEFELCSSDGKDILTSDKDKQTYTEADAEDQITKSNCKAHGSYAEQMECHLANTCTTILDNPKVLESRLQANKTLIFCHTSNVSSQEPQSKLIPIVVVVAVVVMAVITALAGFAFRKRKQGSEGGSNSSNAGSNISV